MNQVSRISWKDRVALAVLLLAVSGLGADWPEFRGPTGQGLATAKNLPVEWTSTQNVAWKQPLPGEGWSSPVLWNGRLYLTAAVPEDHEAATTDYSLRAISLDAKSGKVLWDVEVFREEAGEAFGIHSKNSHASPTPVVHGEQLFVHFGHEGCACLDLNGQVLWRNDEFRYNPVHGNGGSPVVTQDAVIFSCDGADSAIVLALSRRDGRILWKTERGAGAERSFSFSTPLLITVNGREQLVSTGSSCAMALDPQTGEEIWRVRYDGYSLIPRPVFGHGLVYLCTGYNQPEILAVAPDGRGDVTATHIRWRTARAAPHTPSPLLVGDELYTISDRGVASCLDAKTGSEHWRERMPGNYSASPVYGDGKIYFQSEEGVGTVIRAGKKFELLSRNDLGERSLASYAVDDGALFIRTASQLYCIRKP